MRKEAILCLLFGILALPVSLIAQEDKPAIPLEKFYVDRKGYPIRALLKDLRFSASTGFGTTYFRHNLEGFGIYQTATKGPYIFKGSAIPKNGHAKWIDTNVPDTIINANAGFLVFSDTAELGFKSKSVTIPISLSVHYELKNLRVGLGFAKDFIFIKPFSPISYQKQIREVKATSGTISTTKYFGMIGYSFYRIDKYLFIGDLHFGTNKFGKNFNRAVITPSTFFNLGITAERELSEYLKVFIRPNFDIKSYTISLPESNASLKHSANALVWNIGLTYSIPELPKCKIKECRIQMNHAHGEREVRSRAHPFYKKQNPGYGENHPKLIKFRWWNKNKINPY